MNELLLNAQRARFGQSSEKRGYVLPDSEQMRIFNEAEAVQDPKAPEPAEETVVKAHTRKPRRTVDELTEGLPVEKIILDLTEEEQVCGTCGSKLKRIGEKLVRREIETTRKQVRPLEYYTVTYGGSLPEEMWEAVNGLTPQNTLVNGLAARLYADVDGIHHLVWHGRDPDDTYWITAPLTGGELIKIARSVGSTQTAG